MKLRKYPEFIYEAAMARYHKRQETLKEIAESLEINYHALHQWIKTWREHARKSSQSLER